jgi:DNA-binding transcriptional LysR family regulator
VLARATGDGFGLISRAISDLRANAARKRSWVLSCEPTLLMRWLIPRWPDFQARHPQIDVQLVAGGGPFTFNGTIDLAIRRDDFPWPDSYHAEPLFAEKIGLVCRPDKVAQWFAGQPAGAVLRPDAPPLHSRTRPQAWQEWAGATGMALPETAGQHFEHFYFSLQAAVAGLGVAIGPWHLVRDDLHSGVLSAPLGFVEDGSGYCLLSPAALPAASPQAHLLAWLRSMS